jgi:hypothetical protein
MRYSFRLTSALQLIARYGAMGCVGPRPGTPPSESDSRLADALVTGIFDRTLEATPKSRVNRRPAAGPCRYRGRENPAPQSSRELLCGTVRAHRPDGGHRPDADLRRTASADDPGPVRGPLQRTAPSSRPSAPPAAARSPCCGPLPEADPAPAYPRRPHQRIRAGRIEAQIRTDSRVLELCVPRILSAAVTSGVALLAVQP